MFMESWDKYMEGKISINWYIENFLFCWHKTGERLESPLFHIDTPSRTSWRFWLYPRGKDDGKYISFYLFREKGGHEEVEVDFELFLYPTQSKRLLAADTMKRCSFKIHQNAGFKCLVARSKISHQKTDVKDRFDLYFVCLITTRERKGLGISKQYLFTRIERERIYGTEILDAKTNLDSIFIKDIDVKPMLEDEPLINLSLSYVADSLVIKICPVNCREIKFAVCKITVIKNWGSESPIEHVRYWIGEIKADSWRYYVLPETISSKQDFASSSCKAFVFHYDFAFSTGEMMVKWEAEEFARYVEELNVPISQYFNVNIKTAKSALDALEENYLSESFADVKIGLGTSIFPIHKAIIATQSPKLKLSFEENFKRMVSLKTDNDCFKDLLLFFYSDTFKSFPFDKILKFYGLAFRFNLEPLKTRFRCILGRYITNMNAVYILYLADGIRDLSLKNEAKEHIVTNYETVIYSTNWSDFKYKPEFRKEIILSKYKKQKTIT